jgi:hypothetical protein
MNKLYSLLCWYWSVSFFSPHITDALLTRPRPRDVKEVQIFLGICNYYRRLIKGFAAIAEPLTRFLKTGVDFKWKDEQEKAFALIIKALTSRLILRLPDLTRPFTIHTDASMYALGAVLTQHDENGDEYVVAYASRLLKGAELNFGITAKEGLAVLWACKMFHPYIDGMAFSVCTDYSALTSLLRTKEISGRMARMALELQGLQIKNIIHRKGILHNNADTLSRPPLSSVEATQVNKAVAEMRDEANSSQKQLDP